MILELSKDQKAHTIIVNGIEHIHKGSSINSNDIMTLCGGKFDTHNLYRVTADRDENIESDKDIILKELYLFYSKEINS